MKIIQYSNVRNVPSDQALQYLTKVDSDDRSSVEMISYIFVLRNTQTM